MFGAQQNATDLVPLIAGLMDRYVSARAEPFKHHDLHGTMRRINAWFRHAASSRPLLKVKTSMGMGNWAVVPSIAFMDSRETTSTSDGVYVIVLFRGDMSGFYLTLNQGITKPVEFVGRTKARLLLRDRATEIRARFPQLRDLGFETNAELDMRAAGKLEELADSTVAHRFFAKPSKPSDATALLDYIETLLRIYDRYIESPIPIGADRSAWMRTRSQQ